MGKMSKGKEYAIITDVSSIILLSKVMDLLADVLPSLKYLIFNMACSDMGRIIIIIND